MPRKSTTVKEVSEDADTIVRMEAGRGQSVDFAYRFLVDAIQNQRFKPGDRLRESELAEMIGVSRTPIRHALAKLESDGLATSIPTGIIVTEPDLNMVAELYFMRELLEGTSANLAAKLATLAEIALLEELAEQHSRAAESGESLTATNEQFHEALYRCAHNRYIVKALAPLPQVIALLGESNFSDPERARVSSEEHWEIVRAIQQRDPERAEKATREHIRAAHKLRIRRLIARKK